MRKPKNKILGTDFSGRIEAVGNAVRTFKTGDKVFGFDDLGIASHAQYISLSENKPFDIMPEKIGYEQAASSIERAHYAYNFINKVNLLPGQKVLVNGSTGSIGSAMVQLLKYFDAHVTATCNTRNMELIKSLGADELIDYQKTDFTVSQEKFDFVSDAVGKSSFGKCKRLLKPGGVFISSELGENVQNPLLALITPIFGGKKVVFPFPSNTKGSIVFIKRLIEEGRFKAVIERTYALEEIVEAFNYVETGEKTGHVVIRM